MAFVRKPVHFNTISEVPKTGLFQIKTGKKMKNPRTVLAGFRLFQHVEFAYQRSRAARLTLDKTTNEALN
ncbi:hypothetical protein ATN84_16840 [Paramesorhizobium deserti]|uniref:Uncharacterized protein n=1 Tax=Paramesorhizobium deserti TaxID=1494590 RepID=A0A135HR33_9HYPH|nr:hypothetical protein ATN84_16840 [Paramesorhizobium deserti]